MTVVELEVVDETHLKRADENELVSPVHRCPPEILAEIFVQGVHNRLTFSTLKLQGPPWVYGRVCSRWRAVSLATPRIWSYIDFNDEVDESMEMLSVHLQRSGTYPLSLNLRCRTVSKTPFLQELLLHSDRWVHFESLMPNHLFRTLFIDKSFPSLRSLNWNTHRWTLPSRLGLFDAFTFAPNLRSVTLATGLGDSFSVRSLQLPWSQLTYFQGGDGRSWQYREILSNTPNLMHLSCTLYGDTSEDLSSTYPMILPHLKSISVFLHEPGLAILELLDGLVLPGVQEVRILGDQTSPTGLLPLLRRSSRLISKTTRGDSQTTMIISGHPMRPQSSADSNSEASFS